MITGHAPHINVIMTRCHGFLAFQDHYDADWLSCNKNRFFQLLCSPNFSICPSNIGPYGPSDVLTLSVAYIEKIWWPFQNRFFTEFTT